MLGKTGHSPLLSRSKYDTSMTDSELKTKRGETEHPYVSEKTEGKPYAEWIVAAVAAACAVLAFMGYTMAATVVLAATAIVLGVMRIALRQRSSWKVRSVGFDTFISMALGAGLLITYCSITFLL